MVKQLMLVRGCFRILLLYDVAEALDLDKLRQLLGPRAGAAKGVLPRRTPEYLRFEYSRLVEAAEPITVATGERVLCSINYYAFAVAVVQFEVAFECEWDDLLQRASRWIDAADTEPRAREILSRHLAQVSAAIIKPNENWLHESYLITNIDDVGEAGPDRMAAAELLSAHGQEIAQLIRGELAPLSPLVTEEILQASLSYYASDLVVVGSSSALVYERSEDAAASILVLEYAKMQLLEFRYYDGLMTRLLSDVYDALERRRNAILARWSIPRDAQRFNTIRLDVMELTERIDNSIKFVSDVHYARLYRLAAARMGVPDYRNLVDDKLEAVGELYDFMVDQFNETRTFIVEVAIAILALMDVILLFRWK